MDPQSPTSPDDAPSECRPRPRHRWSFERLEGRTLLSGGPAVVTPAELASARAIGGEVATGSVAPGSRTLFRLDPSADQLLVATLHAPGASARLRLLDGQGRELTRSEGRSATDRDAVIAQHLIPGTDYLEVEGLAGAGPFGLTTRKADASVPNQPVPIPSGGIIGPPFALGDFNGDGRPDLAAGTGLGVAVRLGVGDGTFGPPANYLAAYSVESLAVGDFNGDGRPDLTTPRSLLLNAGDGSFTSPRSLTAGIHANPLVIDPNGDLAVLDQAGNLLVRRAVSGQPGRYEPPTAINPGSPAIDFTVVSNGGRALIAAADARDNAVSFYAQIDGRFARLPAAALTTGSLPAQVVSADLDGDGLPDLVVRNAGDGTASVFLGLAGGGFLSRPAVAIGRGASSIATADLDGLSGRIALVVTDQITGEVRVHPNLGFGTFGPPARYQAGAGPYAQATGADGSTDLVSAEQTAAVAVGPLTVGGPPVLVTINPGSNTLALLDGLGGGAFANARVVRFGDKGRLPYAIHSAKAVRLAHLNGDGLTDLVLLGSNGVTVYLGDDWGGFLAQPTIRCCIRKP
jgi:hypothetical protein